MNQQVYRMLWQYIGRKKFFFGFCLSVIGTISSLFFPQIIGQLLNIRFLTRLANQPLMIGGWIAFFLLVNTIRAVAVFLIGSSASQGLKGLQQKIYQHLLQVSVSHVEQFSSGDLASRLTNDMSVVLRFIASVIPNLLLNAIVVVGSIYFLFTISPVMTILSLLVVPVLLLVLLPINQKLEHRYSNYQSEIGQISSQISHKFSHLRLLKAFCGEKSEGSRMNHTFEKLSTNYKHIIAWSAFQATVVSCLMMSLIILLLVIAGGQVAKGAMSISSLTTFVLYVLQLLEPLAELSDAMVAITEFKSVSKRLMEIWDVEKEETSQNFIDVHDKAIQFESVNFAYGHESVLKKLTLRIPEGKHTAIIGPSGAGKSTIFSLLLKFYPNYQGSIQIGNRELKELSAHQMRQLISYIPQDNTLFHGTIRENLLYGKNEDVSDSRLADVLHHLGLSSVIESLENGLDTEISDSGSGLSEGQKQRFSIARALLKNHAIYLLDEVTANLDQTTEKLISKAIDTLTAGKTRLTIAHRLHTIQHADYIVVLGKDGSVVEFGQGHHIREHSTYYRNGLRALPEVS